MAQHTKDFNLSLYRTMLSIRYAEESLVDPIISHTVKCPCHLYSGQEAVAVGVCAALNREDYVFGNHRSHGHYLAKGGDLKAMIAEIYGADTGCARGRGGSMHLIDLECGVLGAAPIVAGTISLALGAALASSIRKDGRVSVSFFGDGSTGEGVLYESLNFAALKKLPMIFVCENNLYATHMPIRDCRPKDATFDVAKPFGVKSSRTDGNDVFRVYETALAAATICRNGEGPVFIECLTYRLRGHVGPDDYIQGTRTDIRPAEEIERWKRKDPIKRMRRKLLRDGIFTREELDRIENDIQQEVKAAHVFAQGSHYPVEEELLDHVFK
jgi:TPP-dependent pyruvate/acetoin dehydrogenase alpha subunit